MKINKEYLDKIEFIYEWLGIKLINPTNSEKCKSIIDKYYNEAIRNCQFTVMSSIDDIY